jgi:hypothetical protein
MVSPDALKRFISGIDGITGKKMKDKKDRMGEPVDPMKEGESEAEEMCEDPEMEACESKEEEAAEREHEMEDDGMSPEELHEYVMKKLGHGKPKIKSVEAGMVSMHKRPGHDLSSVAEKATSKYSGFKKGA